MTGDDLRFRAKRAVRFCKETASWLPGARPDDSFKFPGGLSRFLVRSLHSRGGELFGITMLLRSSTPLNKEFVEDVMGRVGSVGAAAVRQLPRQVR